MSLQNEDAAVSGYGSSDETASLLVLSKNKHTIIPASQSRGAITKAASINGPVTSASGSGVSKPILTRQECTTSSYLISPNTSQILGGSEESGGPGDDDSQHQQQQHHQHRHQQQSANSSQQRFQTSLSVNATSVPDLDAQYRLEAPVISISAQSYGNGHRCSVSGYQLDPHSRCRNCRTCERRASTTPVSSLHLARSVSRESVRSQVHGHLSPHSLNVQQHIPPVLITSSPNSGSTRIIRQSSQPEASNIVCCTYSCSHTAPNMSLRQLREPSDGIGIAGIAADSLRINGAMRPFRQVCSFGFASDLCIFFLNVFIACPFPHFFFHFSSFYVCFEFFVFLFRFKYKFMERKLARVSQIIFILLK